uniref:Uncharacterized protein n=1 Tax=Arundo donax TaxID=35708 RepID=A0A0A9BNM0_ARUDO
MNYSSSCECLHLEDFFLGKSAWVNRVNDNLHL